MHMYFAYCNYHTNWHSPVTYIPRSKKSRMTYDMEGMLNEDDVVKSPILLEAIKRNIVTNASELISPVDVREFEWGPAYESQLQRLIHHKVDIGTGVASSIRGTSTAEDYEYDLLVGSDLTYHSSTASDLFWTVSTLLKNLTARKDNLHQQQAVQHDLLCDEDEEWEESGKLKFITAHEHRLDISTKETLNVAVNKFHLQHKVIFESSDKKHSIWMFTLRD